MYTNVQGERDFFLVVFIKTIDFFKWTALHNFVSL